ncbi:hypothetical protein ES703_44107 [subsurface metagenome]
MLILPERIEPGVINPRLVKLSLKKNLINPHFFKYYFESPKVKEYFSLVSHGATMNILNLTILKNLPIPLPVLTEQDVIVNILDKIYSNNIIIKKDIQTTLRKIDILEQSVLKKAFVGRLVPQDPIDAPASVLLERITAEKATLKPARRRTRRRKSQTDFIYSLSPVKKTFQERINRVD